MDHADHKLDLLAPLTAAAAFWKDGKQRRKPSCARPAVLPGGPQAAAAGILQFVLKDIRKGNRKMKLFHSISEKNRADYQVAGSQIIRKPSLKYRRSTVKKCKRDFGCRSGSAAGRHKLLALALALLLGAQHFAGVRIKDLARIEGLRNVQVVGYGLVVGLDGTGDSRQSLIANQSVRNMLKHFGLTLPARRMRLRNVAAVMVTATIRPFTQKGTRIDVQVSSMGDASSLEGGTLLLTPLLGNDGQIYAHAQGPISIGGFNIRTIGGEQVRKNYALVGRVPMGAVVERGINPALFRKDTVLVDLMEPDFTTVTRVAAAINQQFGKKIAVPQNAGRLAVTVPAEYQTAARRIEFLSAVEALEITPDQTARVVVNERTGTIVVGTNVTVSEVAVAHGNLSVEISASPVISQPGPFSQGQTVVVPQTQTQVTTEKANMMVIPGAANVQDIATALNALGVTPRDLIAIFQALKAAGALHAELVIM